MSLANKALFVIERSLNEELSLDEIAARCGVSRFHLCATFGRAFGISAMGYVRGLRLTEAARALSRGAPNILHVALDSGYSSHEAFSRAFKAQFGLTPEEARLTPPVEGWTEPLARLETRMGAIKQPEIRREGALLFVGVKARMAYANIMAEASAQWRRFMAEAYADIP
jgi:AraC family transcriptional regulator